MKMLTDSSGRLLCPVCRIPMDYAMETEKNSNGERRITRYYKCPACGSRIIDEQLLVKTEGSMVKVLVLSNGKPTIVRRALGNTGKRRAKRVRRVSG